MSVRPIDLRRLAYRLLGTCVLLCVCLAGAGCGSGVAVSAPAGTISGSASSLTFATTPIGTTAATQTITVSVSGAPVTFSSVAIAGTNASSFTATSTCQGTLAAGSTCTVVVSFAPQAAGTLAATLTFSDSAAGSPQTVALSGTGTALAPVAVLSATSISFGSRTVNAPAVSQTVTLTNSGNAALVLSGVTLAPVGVPYTLSGTCVTGLSVAPAMSCTLTVSYAPTAVGTQAATITVTSNAAASPQTVQVSGTAYSGLPFSGVVRAAGQPVAGASVQLYSAGTAGNGSAATALLAAPLTTDSAGAFSVPGQYNCAASTTQLYLVASGGTSVPSSLTLLTALGACSSILPGGTAMVNEATSVAGIFALAPFYQSAGAIGATATNTTGLANAFLTAAELASPAAGTVPGTSLPANVTAPTRLVDTLANIVSGCAVSTANCTLFFTAATPAGGTAPTNTLDALAAVAAKPGNSVAALYALSIARQTFTPVLAAPPTDFSLYLIASGGGLNTPGIVAVDSAGSVWIANYFGGATKLTTTGSAVFPSGLSGFGIQTSYGLAIDLKDNVWIANEDPYIGPGTHGSITKLTAAGAPLSGASGFTAGGIYYPLSVAIDPNGTVWVMDYGNSHVTLLDAAGTPLTGASGVTSPLFAFPEVVVVDGRHYGWIGNQTGSNVIRMTPDGSSFVAYDCCSGAGSIAIDQGNNVWVANFSSDSVSLISSAGQVVSKGYTGGGSILRPDAIAIDGAGSVWVAHYRAPYVVELAGVGAASPGAALTPAAGLGADAGIVTAYSLAIDASGNVWVTSQGNSTVTKFVGLAVPVKTPVSGVAQTP